MLVKTRAWEIKRQDSRYIFALCLKMAWAETKIPAKKTFTGCIILETEYGMKMFKLWEKYGKRRIYINRDDGKKSYGYIDLNDNNQIVCDSDAKWALVPAAEQFFTIYNVA